MSEQSLYDRLGGVFAIAAVVDHFSDAIVKNPIVGQTSPNPALREWHTQQLGRLPLVPVNDPYFKHMLAHGHQGGH